MRWRLVAIACVAILSSLAAAVVVVPFALRALVRGLDLTLNGSVWFAASVGTGMDAWTITATVGRAVGSALLTQQALAAGGGLVLLAALALYGLQRLLGFEEESSK
jgi:hypothetical protein